MNDFNNDINTETKLDNAMTYINIAQQFTVTFSKYALTAASTHDVCEAFLNFYNGIAFVETLFGKGFSSVISQFKTYFLTIAIIRFNDAMRRINGLELLSNSSESSLYFDDVVLDVVLDDMYQFFPSVANMFKITGGQLSSDNIFIIQILETTRLNLVMRRTRNESMRNVLTSTINT